VNVVKKIYRLEDDKKIGGVCSGLADYFDIDPTLVRLGVIVLTVITNGAGLFAYVAAWAVMPEKSVVSNNNEHSNKQEEHERKRQETVDLKKGEDYDER